MSSNTHFKICIIISAFVHLTILYPWPFFRSIRRPEIPSQKIELTYFQKGPIKEVTIKDIKFITSIKRKDKKEDIETAGQKEAKSARIKAIEVAVPLEVETYTEAKIELKSEISKDLQTKKNIIAENASEEEGVLENYYLKVREKIKSALEKNGKHFTREGEVYIKFVINKGGVLKDLMLYKNSGRDMRPLEVIAIKSVKEASPFPPFDDEISKTELSLKIPIRFTLRP